MVDTDRQLQTDYVQMLSHSPWRKIRQEQKNNFLMYQECKSEKKVCEVKSGERHKICKKHSDL